MNNMLIIYFQLLIILYTIGYKTYFYKKHIYILFSILVIGISITHFISEVSTTIVLLIYSIYFLVFSYKHSKSLAHSSLLFLIQNTLLIFTWVIGYDFPLMLFSTYVIQSPYISYFIIYFLQLFLLFLLIFFINYFNTRYEILSLISKANKQRNIIPLLIIIINVLLLFVRQYLIWSDSLQHYLYLSLILFMSSCFIILIIFLINKIYSNKFFIENLRKKYEANMHFIDLANEFQHDYKTFLYTSNRYLETNDIDGLKEYFKTLQNYSTELLNYTLYSQIQTIKDPAIQGLLIGSIEQSNKLGLKLYLNIQNIPLNSFFSTIDFARCLSILINNAIEHSTEKIYISFYSSEDTVYCSVKNTYDKPIPNNIFQKKFSTKKGHQGIGLSILSKTVRLYKNAKLEVENSNNWISFTLSYFD